MSRGSRKRGIQLYVRTVFANNSMLGINLQERKSGANNKCWSRHRGYKYFKEISLEVTRILQFPSLSAASQDKELIIPNSAGSRAAIQVYIPVSVFLSHWWANIDSTTMLANHHLQVEQDQGHVISRTNIPPPKPE